MGSELVACGRIPAWERTTAGAGDGDTAGCHDQPSSLQAPLGIDDGELSASVSTTPPIRFTPGVDAAGGPVSHRGRVLRLADGAAVSPVSWLFPGESLGGLALLSGESYRVELEVVSASGCVAAARGDGWLVDADAPSAPAVSLGPVPSVLTESPVVNWSPATDAGGAGVARYEVELADDTNTATILSWREHVVGTALTGIDPPLDAGSDYSIRVRAVDRAGNAAAPGTATFTSRGTISNRVLVPDLPSVGDIGLEGSIWYLAPVPGPIGSPIPVKYGNAIAGPWVTYGSYDDPNAILTHAGHAYLFHYNAVVALGFGTSMPYSLGGTYITNYPRVVGHYLVSAGSCGTNNGNQWWVHDLDTRTVVGGTLRDYMAGNGGGAGAAALFAGKLFFFGETHNVTGPLAIHVANDVDPALVTTFPQVRIGTGLNAPDTNYYGAILETSGSSLLAVKLYSPQFSVTLDGSTWSPGVCPPYEIEFVALHPSNAYLLLVRDPGDGSHHIAALDAGGTDFRVIWPLATPATLPGAPATVNFYKIRFLGGRLYAVGQADGVGLIEEVIDIF